MANISKVYLLNTPLEEDMKNTLYFANTTAQQNYMNSKIVKSYTNVSYQRDTSTFRCPAQIDSIRNCNYIMYQNSAYSNKWFYGFIQKMEYISDGLTDIQFMVDPIQTFMFEFETQPSFIEREHTNNDAIGANTVPENLELGEYISEIKNSETAFDYSAVNKSVFVIACTKLAGWFADKTYYVTTPVPDALIYLGVTDMNSLRNALKQFSGHEDYINSVFVAPKASFQQWVQQSGDYSGTYSLNYKGGFEDSHAVTIDYYLGNNYSPRNKKLLTYPYRYLQVSNQNGSFANYHYEDFRNADGSIDTTPEFELKGSASAGCDAKVYPRKYKNLLYNYDEGISLAKLPVGSWSSDAYTNWLTQNGVNLAVGFISDVASVGVGLATSPAGGGMAVASGLSGIANKVGQIYQHSMQPPQAEGAVNVGNASWYWGYTAVKFKFMTIKEEYAKIADDFLDMFGYATHRVKKPNYAHRQNWWYTKTIDANIVGNIPNEYMTQIKQAYNNGITYWRNPSNFLNYSVSNGIV